jgi:hypothetical protein
MLKKEIDNTYLVLSKVLGQKIFKTYVIDAQSIQVCISKWRNLFDDGDIEEIVQISLLS